MLKPSDELDLSVKAVQAHTRHQVRGEQFDHDLAIESALDREEDVAHAAAT